MDSKEKFITTVVTLAEELAAVVRFHELETVDSKAAELLVQWDELNVDPFDTEDNAELIEQIHQANIVGTCR